MGLTEGWCVCRSSVQGNVRAGRRAAISDTWKNPKSRMCSFRFVITIIYWQMHSTERSLRDASLWDEVKDRLKTSALGMSGGQQQRLCIARALAVQPKVILCDESTASLDPISTGKIEDLLMELKSKYTVIMVTHNMQQAVRISDCCAFFLMGELIEFNWTDTLFSTPQNKKTEDYITGRFC